MSITETMDNHLKALEASSCALSCATNLILLLVKLSVDIKDDQFKFLSACFSPHVDLDSHQVLDFFECYVIHYVICYVIHY